MEPTIKVGTELEIGTVVKILHDGVMIKKAGNEFKVSFEAVERELWDDQDTQTNWKQSQFHVP